MNILQLPQFLAAIRHSVHFIHAFPQRVLGHNHLTRSSLIHLLLHFLSDLLLNVRLFLVQLLLQAHSVAEGVAGHYVGIFAARRLAAILHRQHHRVDFGVAVDARHSYPQDLATQFRFELVDVVSLGVQAMDSSEGTCDIMLVIVLEHPFRNCLRICNEIVAAVSHDSLIFQGYRLLFQRRVLLECIIDFLGSAQFLEPSILDQLFSGSVHVCVEFEEGISFAENLLFNFILIGNLRYLIQFLLR